MQAKLLQADNKGRITLPIEIRKKSQGLFTYRFGENGVLELKPVVGLITSDQAYFWTKRWQKGEREASEDIQKERVVRVPHRQIRKFFSNL